MADSGWVMADGETLCVSGDGDWEISFSGAQIANVLGLFLKQTQH